MVQDFSSHFKEPVGKSGNEVSLGEPFPPCQGNAFRAVVSACDLAVNCRCRIGIVSQICRGQAPRAKIGRGMKRPKRRFKGRDYVPGATDFRRASPFERVAGDVVNFGTERGFTPAVRHWTIARRKQRLFADTPERADKQPGKIAAGVDGALRAVGRPGTFRCPLDSKFRIRGEE